MLGTLICFSDILIPSHNNPVRYMFLSALFYSLENQNLERLNYPKEPEKVKMKSESLDSRIQNLNYNTVLRNSCSMFFS